MLRLVKMNPYNYKLYKNFMDKFNPLNPNSVYLNEILKGNEAADHDKIVHFFIFEEREDKNDPRMTYFLYDTQTNSFIGAFTYCPKRSDHNLFYFADKTKITNRELFERAVALIKKMNYKRLSFNVFYDDADMIDFLRDCDYSFCSKINDPDGSACFTYNM